jgi:hypothetical protein
MYRHVGPGRPQAAPGRPTAVHKSRGAVRAAGAATGPLKALTVKPCFADQILAKTKHKEFRGWRPPTLPYTFLLHSGAPVFAIVALVTVIKVTGVSGDWGWHLGTVRALKPVTGVRGQLGLWKPDDATLRAVEAQLGGRLPAA